MMWNGPFGYADGWGWSWFWPFHFLVPLLFLALIITIIVLFVRSMVGVVDRPALSKRQPPGLDVLEERYARSEMSRDESLEKKRDITA